MMLQHAVLRDGSTWAARAWTCVAGHNIVPRAQQTNFSSAFQYSTQARKRNTTPTSTHLSCEQGGAERLQHSSQAEKCSCSQGHGPEGEARGGSAPRGAITNSRDLWVKSKCCGKNGEHHTSSCKCPQNVFSQRNWIHSSSSVRRCERRRRLRRFGCVFCRAAAC